MKLVKIIKNNKIAQILTPFEFTNSVGKPGQLEAVVAEFNAKKANQRKMLTASIINQ